jgi:hypothetical protein
MLKKIFSTLCLAVMVLFVSNTQANAASVSVVLDTPAGWFSEPETVYKTVQESLDKIFKGSTVEVKSVSECDAWVQIYREENNLAGSYDNSYGSDAARDLTFKKEDLQKMATHFGDDHLVYVRVMTTNARHTSGVFESGQKINVVLDFRIWSSAKNDFSYMKRATTTGKSSTVNISVFGAGSGSSEHAVEKGLKKGLQEIEKDRAKILASMED